LPTTLARQFLPVLTTLLRSELTLSQNERQLLRSQARRKEKGCPYISNADANCLNTHSVQIDITFF
jgi:hypothetical protein